MKIGPSGKEHFYLVLDILQLHYGHSDEAIVASEAVVFHSDVQLVRSDGLFVSDRAGKRSTYQLLDNAFSNLSGFREALTS